MTSLLAALTLTIVAPNSGDPLFARMQGQWLGEGERTQLVSGRHTKIRIEVDSAVVDDRLVSRNHVVEVNGREYRRTYWVKASDETHYVLGGGESPDQGPVESTGTFDGSAFSVEQVLSDGDAPLVIRSRTEFTQDGSVYLETLWQGDSRLSETRVVFRTRAP